MRRLHKLQSEKGTMVFPATPTYETQEWLQARDKDRYVVSLYLRVHRFRVLFFPSTATRWRNNWVKKILSGLVLLLSYWRGRIDRACILPSGQTCLTSRKSSTLVLLESHRSGRDHYWMRLYSASHYQNQDDRLRARFQRSTTTRSPATKRSTQYIWWAWIWFGERRLDPASLKGA